MRTLVAVALLVLVGACSGGSEPKEATPTTSAADAVQRTCKLVRAGIDDFNRQDYESTVKNFQKAKVPAKIYARVNKEPEADALLDAVEYYANLSPDDYPDAARTSEFFARNKTITLTQCASGDPIDESPGTPV